MIFNCQNALHSANRVLWVECDDKYLKDILNQTNHIVKYTHIVYKSSNVSKIDGIPAIDADSICKLENVCVFICQIYGISRTVDFLKNLQITYDHVSNYTRTICVNTIQMLKFEGYIDYLENEIECKETLYGQGKLYINKDLDFSGGNKVIIHHAGISSSLTIGLFGKNSRVEIGNSTFRKIDIMVTTNGCVEIGNDCMFSHNIVLSQSDQHLIFDMATHKRLNCNKNIVVKDHVWLGRYATLLGGAFIPNNCVVAQGAVTSSHFEKTSCIIAGSPAKIIRENIIWSKDSQKFDYEKYEMCSEKKAELYFTEEERQLFQSEENFS